MIIINSETLINFEQHIRISAGPGAGKTYWLVKHIQNILHHSKRLQQTRKVACITYTNIAVETILKRLGTNAEQVEVTTFHSFLYKHVIKPYAVFLAEEYELNIRKLDGHDDQVVHMKKVKHWLENHSEILEFRHPFTIKQLTTLDDNKVALFNWLYSWHYQLDEKKQLIIVGNRSEAYYKALNHGKEERRNLSKVCLDLLELDMLAYKMLYWKEGIIDHNDVLFFSYELIKKYPFILKVLQAKFPYFLVDEFQDTHPIQTEILKMLGTNETRIGIIGDEAQSIFGFQGAKPGQFRSFLLPNIVDYVMVENRRSTNQIIKLLNSIRQDITQVPFRNIEGAKPTIVIGESLKALKIARDLSFNSVVHSLSRINVTSNSMKKEIIGDVLNKELIEELSNKDKASKSNHYRSKIIIACIKATEYAREGNFKQAIRELECEFKDANDETKGKKEALKYVSLLLNKYDIFKDQALLHFYNIIKSDIKPEISKLVRGAAKTFYEDYTYEQIALCVNISEDTSEHRTIHKAKGDEFDNVLLILKSSRDLDMFLSSSMHDNEEHRINYVGLSRAKERLFINVPSMEEKDYGKFENLFIIMNV